jgi:hypothetical protein
MGNGRRSNAFITRGAARALARWPVATTAGMFIEPGCT